MPEGSWAGKEPDPGPSASALPPAASAAAPSRGFGPGARVVIVFAAFGVAIVCLWLGRDLVTPALAALVVVVTVSPVRRGLDRAGAPRWLGTTLVVIVAFAVLLAIGGMIVFAAVEFGHLVTANGHAFDSATTALDDLLSKVGMSRADAEAAAKSIDPKTLESIAIGVTKAVFSSALAFFFVLAYLIFMAADGARHPELEREFGDTRRSLLDALARWAHGVRAYFVVNSLFGVIVALLDGVVLWALGVPGVPIWIVLAFVTNYVPNIGFVIGLIPPAVLALITGGWPHALVVIIAYCVINATLQELVQPKFVASTVSLSLTLTFFSVLFWSAVLGAVGAILAIPMTLLLRALLIEIDPEARWSRWITGDRSA